ncbi:hypothetical protein HNR40_010793 [Nonomuraea endophytica]|uniref:Uncharacterized protein n=1 Tax=Nonomuraea endophytica TaxID=714136 RepID=A0A7W8AGK7_9ACTN|nr:hypothetical protein [Nonomuraea endophytica]
MEHCQTNVTVTRLAVPLLPDGHLVGRFVIQAEQAIREVLGCVVPLREETVRLFLDDFTTADLPMTRLTGIDLAGDRRSETGTRWP